MQKKLVKNRLLMGTAVAVLLAGAGQAAAQEPEVSVHGYVRGWASMNLQDAPETVNDDEAGKLSMVRGQVRLDGSADWGKVKIFTSLRGVAEIETSHEKNLENLGAGFTEGGMEYNDGDIREAYIDWKATDRVSLRLGKQQVVWGESDFFTANDMVHGFDYTWRLFLEPENEELRKPLILATAFVDVPEANGTVQGFVRPGLDRGSDIGNSYDVMGGRWGFQGNNRGMIDLLSVVPYDYDHPDGDKDDPTYGLRWSGIAGRGIGYSLMYLHTFNPDPIVNPVQTAFGFLPVGTPFGKTPTGLFGNFIYPMVDVVGATVTGQVESIDSVLSAEVAYVFDKPFNFGPNAFIPGFGGVIEKDTVRAMVRVDHNLDLTKLIGTSRPSFFTVQLFDTWIVDHDSAEGIVDLPGYAALKDEHSALATMILAMNYMNDKINPSIVLGYDLSYGGGFFVPAVEFQVGDRLRIKAELDIFFNDGANAPGGNSTDTHLFGYFENANQFVTRVTYQF